MRRFLPTFLLIIGLTSFLNAQWVSPGTNTIYTMSDLVAQSEGTVTNAGNIFTIHGDLTISEGDGLRITDEVLIIYVEDALITINGSWVCENVENRVRIYGDPSFSMRFEDAGECSLNHMYFSDGAGIQLVGSNVVFTDCKFLYFTTDYCSAVINAFNCDPVIDNCYFLLNQGAAISSPANGQSSPQITNCELDANVDGLNLPQINLGPGGADTIRIVGNAIHGTYATFHTGGVSVADLLGTGSTKVLLKDNTIQDSRYGYNQQGVNISSVIERNRFIDNHYEDNPMNGGSGISIYGYSTDCKAKLRNNIITGNLWGITAIYLHDIDLGTSDDWGRNEIHDNGNNGTVYDLYDNATCDITAIGNDWGTVNEQEIEDHIFHQADDPSLGLVTYLPYIGYDHIDECGIDDIDWTHAAVYSITGQRVRDTESLAPGVYIILTEKHARKCYVK